LCPVTGKKAALLSRKGKKNSKQDRKTFDLERMGRERVRARKEKKSKTEKKNGLKKREGN